MDIDELAGEVQAPLEPALEFVFCQVLSVDPGNSIEVNYRGTSGTILASQLYCGSWPVADDWVAVARQDGDLFVLGIRI